MISIIFPAYNEEKRLPKTLVEADRYLSLQNFEYEILVVNDGSTDKTFEAVKDLSKQIKNLRIINNKENKGIGFVVRQGLLAAKGEYRLYVDADNSVSINQIENFLPYFKQDYDILFASRKVEGSKLYPPQPWHRKILSGIFHLIDKAIIGNYGIKDSYCGFKIFTGKSAEDILCRCKICRWTFDTEILVVANKLGYKIKEVPVTWRNDADSRVNFLGMVGTLKDLIKIKINLMSGKYEKLAKK